MTDRTHPDSGFPIAYSHYANYAEYVEALHARIAELEAQLESIGAGGVSGPLMGQPQAMPDLSALTERGAKAWAGVDAQGLRAGFTAADMATASAQGFRDGVASVAASAVSEPVAQLAAAQQPAPSAAAASKAVLAAIRAANMQLVRTGDDEFMLVTLKQATPQADSQPAQVEASDAMADSQYLAGVSAGWNAANADDPNEALRKLHESRAGYLKPIRAARAPADSVLEDAVGLERERICAAIKAEDDYCVDHGDYMLDSDDCIKIVRGEWVRPDFAVDAARKQGGAT